MGDDSPNGQVQRARGALEGTVRNSLHALRCNEMLGVCFQNRHRVTLNCRAMCSLAQRQSALRPPWLHDAYATLLLTFAGFAKYISIWVSEASRKARVADVSWVLALLELDRITTADRATPQHGGIDPDVDLIVLGRRAQDTRIPG